MSAARETQIPFKEFANLFEEIWSARDEAAR